MSTIANELLTLNNTKLAIKEAIINQGVEIGEEDTFASYADKIEEIESGGTEIDISKVNYQTGNQNESKLNKGRLLSGFANMTGLGVYPFDQSNTWIDVDWSDSFEIGISFKIGTLTHYQALFGDGYEYSYRQCPRLCYLPTNEIELMISSNGQTLDVDALLNYQLTADTWYFLKLTFIKSTMQLVAKITQDFNNYTTLYDSILVAAPYHNTSSLVFGGDGRQTAVVTNDAQIDTFNTYIKDDTGEIVWGAFAGRFDNGKYPVISKDYDLVEYIESDGTQYIDTGINVIQGQTIKMIFHPLNNQASYAWLFGVGDTTHYYGFQFPQQTLLYVYNGSTSSSGQISVNTADEYVYNLTLTASSPLNLSYYIFGFHYSEDPSGGVNLGKFRLYSFSIDNNFYLPCKRKSDGVFGLYDVANQTFLGDSAGGNPLTGGQTICVFDEATTPTEEIIFNAENIQICTSQGYYLPQQPFDVNITEAGQYIVSLHRISDDKIWSSIITYDGVSDTTFSISYERGFTLHITPTSIGCQYYEGNWTDIYIKLSKALDSQIYVI